MTQRERSVSPDVRRRAVARHGRKKLENDQSSRCAGSTEASGPILAVDARQGGCGGRDGLTGSTHGRRAPIQAARSPMRRSSCCGPRRSVRRRNALAKDTVWFAFMRDAERPCTCQKARCRAGSIGGTGEQRHRCVGTRQHRGKEGASRVKEQAIVVSPKGRFNND